MDFSARFLHSVDHLSCYVYSAALGHSNIKEHPLIECFVSGILLGFPNQEHFNTKLLHSVDHLSYYVCSAALGHNNIKV